MGLLLVLSMGLSLYLGNERRILCRWRGTPFLPALTACVLALQNLAALWMPSWAATSGHNIVGIEAFGQRLLVVFGTLAAVAIVMVPAGGVGRDAGPATLAVLRDRA